jgi:hypothetical protein
MRYHLFASGAVGAALIAILASCASYGPSRVRVGQNADTSGMPPSCRSWVPAAGQYQKLPIDCFSATHALPEVRPSMSY